MNRELYKSDLVNCLDPISEKDSNIIFNRIKKIDNAIY